MEAPHEYIIIDPTSPEPNRGSFCYLPYLLTNALSQTHKTWLYEDFTMPQLDFLEREMGIVLQRADILIALWSYPQIDLCLYLHRHFKGKAKFFGYYPLIEKLGLPAFYYTEQQIMDGMKAYPYRFSIYKHQLLSDCDEHIRGEDGVPVTMYPLFTSYGCPRGCKFCSATVNNERKRIVLPLHNVFDMLLKCAALDYTNIHFTDEDFFYDAERALAILHMAYQMQKEQKIKWQFIALAHVNTLGKFIEHIKAKVDDKTCQGIWDMLKLVEVGLETASPVLAGQMCKRGEKDKTKPSELRVTCPVPILWLTMTFYPGETISTLNETGDFLCWYGIPFYQMSPRLATNGTWGGLGQFFQYYDGCGFTEEELRKEGVILSTRQVRLLPSFVPYSFLNSEFVYYREKLLEREPTFSNYLDMYAVEHEAVLDVLLNTTLEKRTTPKKVISALNVENNLTGFTDVCITLAIMARLGIIKGV